MTVQRVHASATQRGGKLATETTAQQLTSSRPRTHRARPTPGRNRPTRAAYPAYPAYVSSSVAGSISRPPPPALQGKGFPASGARVGTLRRSRSNPTRCRHRSGQPVQGAHDAGSGAGLGCCWAPAMCGVARDCRVAVATFHVGATRCPIMMDDELRRMFEILASPGPKLT